MSLWESIIVALENLRDNKMRAFLTIIGIVVGVSAVVTVVSIGQAGQSSVVAQIAQHGKSYFVLYVNSQNQTVERDIAISQRDIDQMKRVSGVKAVVAEMSTGAEFKRRGQTYHLSITGTSSEYPQVAKLDFTAGHFFSGAQERARLRVMTVESDFANEVFGSKDAALGRKIVLGSRRYQIIGVYKSDHSLLSGLGSKTYKAFMPMESLPIYNDATNYRFSYIQVKAASDNSKALHKTIDAVRKLLARRHNTNLSSYSFQTAQQTQDQVKSVFGILQTIIGSIAGISLLVGGIGVMNIMLVSVTERTREIGIRKAIGATPGMIMGQFLIEALILSFMGGAIGTGLGLAASYIFSIFTKWPFMISWWAILLAFGFSAIVGVFFGLYPASKASRLQPIESLRYE